MPEEINDLQVGELVSWNGLEGVVVYSHPVFNEHKVRLTVHWVGDHYIDFIRHLECKRIAKPSNKLLAFGKGIIERFFRKREIDNLSYLAAKGILNSYGQ